MATMSLDRPSKLSRRRCQAPPIGALKQGLVVLRNPGEGSNPPSPRVDWFADWQKGSGAANSRMAPRNLAANGSGRTARVVCEYEDRFRMPACRCKGRGSDHREPVVRSPREGRSGTDPETGFNTTGRHQRVAGRSAKAVGRLHPIKSRGLVEQMGQPSPKMDVAPWRKASWCGSSREAKLRENKVQPDTARPRADGCA